ncbi:imidazolonepropionase [Hahella sp. KA22]|uniref:imidazolonepropionase n=1 Tax=Hahella sp. KA22 TaxID=1628392 RepID=UPI000FDF3331|nr:imidazolonepropionase [Hahella sp. KA22]AZZ91952.1 imidazolonepropionase [Hahella sp. KA22]QAY55323.1 imidazolonepropionase [Hahella sp. KA22]
MDWWINARIATLDPDAQHAYGLLENHALGVAHGNIEAIVPMSEWDGGASDNITDANGRLITPGLVDCHTHLVYGGDRAAEFEMRLQGVSYADIAKQGGGIISTVRATRAATEKELLQQSEKRLLALLREGVTTVEIKSGYGLDLESELKMLHVARRLGQRYPVNIRTTLLAAHALPPEYAGRSDDYISWICEEALPMAHEQKLADAVDVFCESIAFTPEQCRRVFEAAQKLGLPVKGHMEQLTLSGGSALAAEFNALSVDHVEYLDEAGVQAIAASGTVATLLPGAFYFLRETQRPPMELLRRHKVPMALATDLNPGSCPLASMRLMMNMGCTFFGMTPEETLAGVTRHGAKALGMQDRIGRLAPGMAADFIVWDCQHPAQLSYEFGVTGPHQRVFHGEIHNV